MTAGDCGTQITGPRRNAARARRQKAESWRFFKAFLNSYSPFRAIAKLLPYRYSRGRLRIRGTGATAEVLLALLTAGVLAAGAAAAIPSRITFQGSLKRSGVVTNGVHQMVFRITNADGTQVYWSSPSQAVTVTGGLFSTELHPTGVDWQAVTPYVEVAVDGQVLLPRQPITANVYALMSASVEDGAITPAKLSTAAFQASGIGVVPPGAIVMYSAACPTGWMRVSALDGRFPFGGATYGVAGGSASHKHGIAADGAHDHSGWTTEEGEPGDPRGGRGAQVSRRAHHHRIVWAPNHSHGGSTAVENTLPPYMTVVFCQKQ
jgi:hypothetical protein